MSGTDSKDAKAGAVVSSGTIAVDLRGASGAGRPVTYVAPAKPTTKTTPAPLAAPEPAPPPDLRLESGHIGDLLDHIKAWVRWHTGKP